MEDELTALSERDRAFYAWQLDVPGFGEEGQRRLRGTTAMVSRIGGLGGPMAFALAAAGIGRLILVHGGDLEPSDLNRQILMRHEDLGTSRVASAAATLRAFNPHIEVETVPSHVTPENVDQLVQRADIVFDAAPRFGERFAMNAACVRHNKPSIDAAMYDMEGQVVVIVPGRTPCLACLYPEEPLHWKRRFPVIGAVSAMLGNMAVLEGIKWITGMGEVNLNTMLHLDARSMRLRKISLSKRLDCEICGAFRESSCGG